MSWKLPKNWRVLIRDVFKRFIKPWGHPTFVFYFFASAIMSAAGFWLTVFQGVEPELKAAIDGTVKSTPSTSTYFYALLTYFPAIGSTACFYMITVENDKKHMRGFATLCLVILLVVFFMSLYVFQNFPQKAYRLPIFGVILGLFIWWISIADQVDFQDDLDLEETLGGSPQDPLSEGDHTDGITV